MTSKANPFSYFKNIDPEDSLWAKDDGTSLQEHSFKVKEIADSITENLFIHPLYNHYQEILKSLIILSAYIHDAGKVDQRWQDYIKNKNLNRPAIPHPLFSIPIAERFLYENLEFENNEIKKFLIDVALVAIATHHSPVTNEKYEAYKSYTTKYPFPLATKDKPYSLFDKARNTLITSTILSSQEKRYLYTLINGVISYCDWCASLPHSPYIRISSKKLEGKLTEYFCNKNLIPYSYQNKAKQIEEDILIQLPTGKGKTETALFWLLSQNVNKIFYILPTVTTVDAMRSRFEKIFGKEWISFSHHLLEISLFEEERLSQHELFIQKHLLKPIAVTTIDKILLTLMNYGHYTVNEIMLNNAAIVIDEIHSYSPFTFSLIIEAIRYLKEYHNVRICIMSATLPKVIECTLKSASKGCNPTPLLSKRDVNSLYQKEHRTRIIPFREGISLIDSLDDIQRLLNKNDKVLIVTNTVSCAQYLFKNLKTQTHKKILFHSRFTYGDRYKKQKEIDSLENRPQRVVLIATQIVEVSLNIDYDVLITELAPIDALIQRAGRVNRKGKKQPCDIYIFDIMKGGKGWLPYEKEQIEKAKKLLSGKSISSELEYIRLNEGYYKTLKDKYEQELKENHLSEFLMQVYEKANIDKALSTRDGFISLPVVPFVFKEKVEKLWGNIQHLNEKIKRTIDKVKKDAIIQKRLNLSAKLEEYFVPLSLYNIRESMIQQEPFIVVDLKYDQKLGLMPPRKVKPEIIII